MSRGPDLIRRLQARMAWHQALHDPRREPRNRSPWLGEVRRWQAGRLERSFDRFLADPARRPAARFFLTDVYGDHDFTRRNADLARVLPMMQRLLPAPLLGTIADGIELGALTHALDLRMAAALEDLAPAGGPLDDAPYAAAYRTVGLRRLRAHQIDLVHCVGTDLAGALRMPGIAALLRLSRGPAKAAGLGNLQGFLERGFDAFARLDDPEAFLDEIDDAERALSGRLFAGGEVWAQEKRSSR